MQNSVDWAKCKYLRRQRKPEKHLTRELCYNEDNPAAAFVRGEACFGEHCKYFEEGEFSWQGFDYFDDYINWREEQRVKWSLTPQQRWDDFKARTINTFTFGKKFLNIVPVQLYQVEYDFVAKERVRKKGSITALNLNTHRLALFANLFPGKNLWYTNLVEGCYAGWEVGVSEDYKLYLVHDCRGLGKEWDSVAFEFI